MTQPAPADRPRDGQPRLALALRRRAGPLARTTSAGSARRPTTRRCSTGWRCEFVEQGWSLKAMHRLIMLSSTYQMSTAYDATAAAIDPENRLHWRTDRRRLEAEAIRDALLAVERRARSRRMGGSLLRVANHAYVASTASERYDPYTTAAAVGLPAGHPQQRVRRLPGVRLRRPQRAQRRAATDDGRPAGAVPDEQPAGRGADPALAAAAAGRGQRRRRAACSRSTSRPTAARRATRSWPAVWSSCGGSRRR